MIDRTDPDTPAFVYSGRVTGREKRFMLAGPDFGCVRSQCADGGWATGDACSAETIAKIHELYCQDDVEWAQVAALLAA